MKLNNIIEISHLEKLSKIILLCSLLILFFYLTEVFFVFYNGNPFEITIYKYRTSNGFIASTIIILFCNIIVPQLLWWNRLRTNPIILFAVSVCVLAGMWLERVVIVLSSMERSYLPMNWYGYFPSVFEISLLLGSFGFFLFCYLIIIRIVPSVSIYDNSN